MEERIKKTVAKINELVEHSKFNIFGQEYEEIVGEYGANELMILGCKLCKTPGGVRYLEVPYHGISKRRLAKAVESLEFMEGVAKKNAK